MRRKIYCVLLFLFAVLAQAQETPKPKLWNVKLNVPQLIDVTNFPVVQLSVERKLNSKWSIIAEGGMQFYDDYNNPDTLFYKPRGFKVNVEFRAYLLQIIKPEPFNPKGGLFVGIQPYYRYNQATRSVHYLKEKSETEQDTASSRPKFNDYYGYKRKAYGVNVTIGYQKHLGKRVVLEPSIAIGSLTRRVSNVGRSYDPEKDDSTFDHDLARQVYRSTSNSNASEVNFTINFRVGYKFRL